MARAVLITGGNVGDIKSRLREAQRLINDQIGVVLRCSHTYVSKSWGFESDDFMNQALVVDTDLTPEELLSAVQDVELTLGRDRQREKAERAETGQEYASRLIDIDILLYDDRIINSEWLQIPHPLLHRREFVLTPLREVAPAMMHPTLGQKIEELKIES